MRHVLAAGAMAAVLSTAALVFGPFALGGAQQPTASRAGVPASGGPGSEYVLSILLQGKGSVVSRPKGVSCPGRCTSRFAPHARVVVTARPLKGWRFVRWSYACRGSRLTCAVTVGDGGATVGARFAKLS